MKTRPLSLLDTNDSSNISCDIKGEYDRKENNELNPNITNSSSPDLNLYLSSSELSNNSDDDIEIIGEYIVNSERPVSHKRRRTSDVKFKTPPNYYGRVEANANSQLSHNSSAQSEQSINIFENSSLEEGRNGSKQSSETICFCSNLNEKIQNLIMKTTSLQHQLNGISPSDYNNTQRNPHINSEKDLTTLQDALNSLSFALKFTLRQAETQINSNRNTTHNALNLKPNTTPPFSSNARRMTIEKKQKNTRALYQNWEAISSFPKPLTKVGGKYTKETESMVGKGPGQIIKTSKKALIKGPDVEIKYCLCEKGTLPVTKDMIGCDFCGMWYHPSCIGLNIDDIDEIVKTRWMCPLCDELCDGMFKRANIRTNPNKRKLSCQKMEANGLSYLDENRNSSCFAEQSPKRKKVGQNFERLEIEQSFSLSSGKISNIFSRKLMKKRRKKLKEINHNGAVNYDSNEMTFKSTQYKNARVKTENRSRSKSDKWIVRKKYQSCSENSRFLETSSCLDLMEKRICRKSGSSNAQICNEKWYKKKTKNKKSKRNVKDEFIYKQTLLIKDTKSS